MTFDLWYNAGVDLFGGLFGESGGSPCCLGQVGFRDVSSFPLLPESELESCFSWCTVQLEFFKKGDTFMLLMLTLERLLEGLKVSASFTCAGFKRLLATFEVFWEEGHIPGSGTQKLVTGLDSAYKYRNSLSNSATIWPRKWVTRLVWTWLQSQVKLWKKEKNPAHVTSSQSVRVPSTDFNIRVTYCYPIYATKTFSEVCKSEITCRDECTHYIITKEQP